MKPEKIQRQLLYGADCCCFGALPALCAAIRRELPCGGGGFAACVRRGTSRCPRGAKRDKTPAVSYPSWDSLTSLDCDFLRRNGGRRSSTDCDRFESKFAGVFGASAPRGRAGLCRPESACILSLMLSARVTARAGGWAGGCRRAGGWDPSLHHPHPPPLRGGPPSPNGGRLGRET